MTWVINQSLLWCRILGAQSTNTDPWVLPGLMKLPSLGPCDHHIVSFQTCSGGSYFGLLKELAKIEAFQSYFGWKSVHAYHYGLAPLIWGILKGPSIVDQQNQNFNGEIRLQGKSKFNGLYLGIKKLICWYFIKRFDHPVGEIGGESIFDPFLDPLGPIFAKKKWVIGGRYWEFLAQTCPLVVLINPCKFQEFAPQKTKAHFGQNSQNRLCMPRADFCTCAHWCASGSVAGVW